MWYPSTPMKIRLTRLIPICYPSTPMEIRLTRLIPIWYPSAPMKIRLTRLIPLYTNASTPDSFDTHLHQWKEATKLEYLKALDCQARKIKLLNKLDSRTNLSGSCDLIRRICSISSFVNVLSIDRLKEKVLAVNISFVLCCLINLFLKIGVLLNTLCAVISEPCSTTLCWVN